MTPRDRAEAIAVKFYDGTDGDLPLIEQYTTPEAMLEDRALLVEMIVQAIDASVNDALARRLAPCR